MPLLLQSYIDFEIDEGQRGHARALYERLLERTKHVKVWLSYAAFEAAPLPVDEDNEDAMGAAAARSSGEESTAQREAKARRCGPPCLLSRPIPPMSALLGSPAILLLDKSASANWSACQLPGATARWFVGTRLLGRCLPLTVCRLQRV